MIVSPPSPKKTNSMILQQYITNDVPTDFSLGNLDKSAKAGSIKNLPPAPAKPPFESLSK